MFFFSFNQRYAAFNGGDSQLKRYDHTHTRSENSNSTTIVQASCGYAGNGVSRAGVVVTLAKGKQNISACIFDVVPSCACALEPAEIGVVRLYWGLQMSSRLDSVLQ